MMVAEYVDDSRGVVRRAMHSEDPPRRLRVSVVGGAWRIFQNRGRAIDEGPVGHGTEGWSGSLMFVVRSLRLSRIIRAVAQSCRWSPPAMSTLLVR
jgi:hypothetical protein